MQLRPYNSDRDFVYIQQWITDARTHAKWCANRIPYPLTREGFDQTLENHKRDWGDMPYIFTDDEDKPIGFFAYSINREKNFAFLKSVVVDSKLRGQGYGEKMINLAKEFLFKETEVDSVKLSVFDGNTAAERCYEKAGFIVVSHNPEGFSFGEEIWGRSIMSVPREVR